MDVVAVDGPGGVGKTTISGALAAATGRAHLDTGAMYRAATLAVLEAGIDPADDVGVISVVTAADIGYEDGRTFLDGRDVTAPIRSREVDAAVSAVSAMPQVRSRLVELQRSWVERHGPSVAEGRDMGTVVFAKSKRKVFLTADPSVRAARRSGDAPDRPVDDIAGDLKRRDKFDSSRAISPLRPAQDAAVIDTTDLSEDEVLAAVLQAVGLES
ncbi:MAG: (d)CMP kinase [Acidimicrobiia bacterium]